MVENGIKKRMAEQVGIVIDAAREKFTDSLEVYLKEKGVQIVLHDKQHIENIFSHSIHAYITAEMAAFLSFLVYSELKNEDILNRIVPDFLDEVEGQFEQIPESLSNKTKELKDIAKGILDSNESKAPLVAGLIRDIVGMSRFGHLRASFDAAILSFMEE